MVLTLEQPASLDRGEPVMIVVDGRECVLLKMEAYQQQRALVDDWEPRMLQRQMAEMMSEDWSDPAMSVYDDD